MVLASTWIDRVANSTPIVDLLSRLNSLRVNRLSRLDFPTPESPIRTTAVSHGIVSGPFQRDTIGIYKFNAYLVWWAGNPSLSPDARTRYAPSLNVLTTLHERKQITTVVGTSVMQDGGGGSSEEATQTEVGSLPLNRNCYEG